MITDATLAMLSAEAYSAPASWAYEDVRAVRTALGKITVIAFRGTVPTNAANWRRDISAWPAHHAALGWCHAGFLFGAVGLWPAIRMAAAGRRVVLTGHSLGGALAVITAGLLMAAGMPPAALVTFGAPRAGSRRLRRLISAMPIVRQYRNGDDPVPRVPWCCGFYRHMRPLIQFGDAAPEPILDHAITLYQSRIAELEITP
jgi:Lipase (class 3)